MFAECKGIENKGLADSPPNPLQTNLQKDSENGSNQGDSIPDDLAELTTLWPDLPDNIKEAIRAIVKPFRK